MVPSWVAAVCVTCRGEERAGHDRACRSDPDQIGMTGTGAMTLTIRYGIFDCESPTCARVFDRELAHCPSCGAAVVYRDIHPAPSSEASGSSIR